MAPPPGNGRSGAYVLQDRADHILGAMRLWEVDDPEVGATLEVDCEPRLCNPHGSPHASVLAALIDCGAARVAVASTGTDALAGSDLSVRFLSPVAVGPARVLARLLKAGRTAVVVQADVIDVGRDRRLCATATMSFTRLDGR